MDGWMDGASIAPIHATNPSDQYKLVIKLITNCVTCSAWLASQSASEKNLRN